MILSELLYGIRAAYYLGIGRLYSLSKSPERRAKSIILLEKGIDYVARLYEKHPTRRLNSFIGNTRHRIRNIRYGLRQHNS